MDDERRMKRRGVRSQRMKIDLTELIERGEGAYLLFPMKTRVVYIWHAGGRAHLRQRLEGYLVPVADSVVREQLKHLHVGCEVKPGADVFAEEDADQLDNVFRLAGVPFGVDRAQPNTENAVWVRFPGEEEIPIQFSRYRKWQGFWGRQAVFVWWQCESEQQWLQRMEVEWRERGLPAGLRPAESVSSDEDDDEEQNHHER